VGRQMRAAPIPTPLSFVSDIAPYQPGKPIDELARELGFRASEIVKLASNENPLGCSPKVRDAIQGEIKSIARYPDGSGHLLKEALGKKFHIDPAKILLGNGSNDILEMASIAFLDSGLSSVFSEHCFVVNKLATLSRGAEGIEVPARQFGHDLDGMLLAIRADTRVIFVSNPNNPTGTFVTPEKVREFIEKVPKHVLVVLDEAYTEYLEERDQSNSLSWVDEFSNLLVTRTFSKIYGLASLRIGVGVGNKELIEVLNRIRQPFNVSSFAQAGVVAALADDEFIERSREVNRQGMAQLVSGLKILGIEHIPSFGNFLTIDVGDGKRVFDALLREGVIVRPIGGYGMPRHIRVSIGLQVENEKFLEALQRVLSSDR
jgi:histidinol-phosphate aminotransferase